MGQRVGGPDVCVWLVTGPVPLPKIRPNGLVLGVALERLGSLLAAVAAQFVPTEGRVWMVLVPSVQPDGACLDAVSEPERSSQVSSLNAGR